MEQVISLSNFALVSKDSKLFTLKMRSMGLQLLGLSVWLIVPSTNRKHRITNPSDKKTLLDIGIVLYDDGGRCTTQKDINHILCVIPLLDQFLL